MSSFTDRGSREDRGGRDRPSRWSDERDRGGSGGDDYRGGSVTFFHLFNILTK